jgi:hypothetical protein
MRGDLNYLSYIIKEKINMKKKVLNIKKITLSFNEYNGIVDYMLQQDSVVNARYGAIGLIIDVCTDYTAIREPSEDGGYGLNPNEIDKVMEEFKSSKLNKLYEDVLRTYEIQVNKTNMDTFISVICNVTEQLNSIDTESMAVQFGEMIKSASEA